MRQNMGLERLKIGPAWSRLGQSAGPSGGRWPRR
jgi:hypothetical protein